MRLIGLGVLALVAFAPVQARGQANTSSPQELHNLIVARVFAVAPRPLPSGDTLVSWYQQPVLFHIVQRAPERVSEAMLRSDGLVGTAEVAFQDGHPTSATVLWTQEDSVATDVQLRVRGDSLLVTGTTKARWLLPSGAWAIADYGMEDLIVPVLRGLPPPPAPQQIIAYRPFAARWDTLTVTNRIPVADAVFYDLANTDGKRDGGW